MVYSVLRDGNAHLVWPFRGDGKVESVQPLDPGLVLHDESAGDESLVAIAIPLDHSWGRMEGWLGYCKASSSFEPGEFYPNGAAAARATYTVRPQGGSCDQADVSAYKDAIFHAEPCGR